MNLWMPMIFDVRAVKKSCVHIINNQYKMIHFQTIEFILQGWKN